MEQTTIRAKATTLQSLEEEASEEGVTRSEYIRSLLRNRHEPSENTQRLRSQIAECEDELSSVREERDNLSNKIDDLETEIEQLKNEKQVLVNQREDNTELMEYVEREKDLQEKYRKAGLLTKTKWAIFGMDDE